ncbi:MAG TPA: LEA type 2 family protein [Geobacteraceae bacterium]|nr:LEA type 2 family protein [Geobacteraceae bacterium]
MKKLLFATLIFLTACTMSVQNPTVKLKSVKLTGLDGRGASLNFLLNVTNPNSFDLSLKGYSFDVHVLGRPLTRGESDEYLTFPGKKTTEMLIPVRISYTDILEIMKRSPELQGIPYQLNADLTVDTSVGTIVVPVRKNGLVSIPEEYQPGNLLQKFGNFLNNRKR